jgi:hypothetical protein
MQHSDLETQEKSLQPALAFFGGAFYGPDWHGVLLECVFFIFTWWQINGIEGHADCI